MLSMIFRNNLSLSIGFLLIAMVLGMMIGCIDEIEGCLDNGATNFNAVADIPCDDCCDFPDLRINVAHRIQDSFSLSYGTPYPYLTMDSQAYFTISKPRSIKSISTNLVLIPSSSIKDTSEIKKLNSFS